MKKESTNLAVLLKAPFWTWKGSNVEKEMFQLVWEEKSSYFLMLLVSKAPPDAQAAQLHQGQWPLEKDPGKRLHTWLYNAKAMNLKQQLCITAPSTSCNPPLTSFSLSAVKSQICICQRTLAHLQSSPCLVTLSLHIWPQQQQSFPFKLHKCLHCLRRDDWCYFKSPSLLSVPQRDQSFQFTASLRQIS